MRERLKRDVEKLKAAMPQPATASLSRQYAAGLKRLPSDQLKRLTDLLQMLADVRILPAAEAEELSRLEALVMEKPNPAEIALLESELAGMETKVIEVREGRAPFDSVDPEAVILLRERLEILREPE